MSVNLSRPTNFRDHFTELDYVSIWLSDIFEHHHADFLEPYYCEWEKVIKPTDKVTGSNILALADITTIIETRREKRETKIGKEEKKEKTNIK